MRFCMPTTVSLNVATKKDANGRLIYKLSGPATLCYSEFIEIVDRLFYNRTYYLTSDVEECGIRMRKNMSDVETSYFSYYRNLTYYTVPVPVIISKTSIITGSKLDSVQSGDSASLMENFFRFKLHVYLWSICLILLFVLIIASRILVVLNSNRIRHSNRHKPPKHHHQSSLISCVARKTVQHAWSTFCGSSNAFRWLGLLFTLFSFFVVTFFLSTYSTSEVIVEEPFFVKNYQELLDTKTCLPMFYDLVSKVSHQFRDAPVGSMKQKVWLKLKNSSEDPSGYAFSDNTMNPREVMLRVVERLERDKSVFIASSLIANMLRTFGCGSSDDGSSGRREEFWRLITVSDPVESEDIFGWALSRRLEGDKSFARKVSRLFYSGILVDFFNKQTDASAFASTLAGTNQHHLYEAMRICSEDYKAEANQYFQAVALSHYRTFFYLYLYVFTGSSFILAFEITYKCCTSKRFQRKKRDEHILGLPHPRQ